MAVLDSIKAGFALGVPASRDVINRIAAGTLVHRTRLQYIDKIVTGVIGTPTGAHNCMVRLTGDFGLTPLELLRSTLRDHRIVDFGIFQGAAGRGFTDYVYFFLGEPEDWQIKAQNYGGDGVFATIRIRGADLLSDPDRKIFYRRGLFWEADKAVIVKGGYAGPANVDLPASLKTSFV